MDSYQPLYIKKDEFIDRHKNLVLQNFSSDLYEILVRAHKKLLGVIAVIDSKAMYIRQIEDCITILNLAIDARTAPNEGSRLKIQERRLRDEYAYAMEDLLIKAVAEIEEEAHIVDSVGSLDDDTMYVIEVYHLTPAEPEVKKVNKAFFALNYSFLVGWRTNVDEKIPTTEELKEVPRPMSKEYLKQILGRFITALDHGKRYIIDTEEVPVRDAFEEIVKLPIHFDNKVYRELYSMCLDLKLIPEEVLISHNKNPGRYVRENYIKSKVKRALEKAIE